MSENAKPTVYRFDMAKAPQHFRSINSWYDPSPAERRVIVSDTHDDYVRTDAINDNIGGSVPRWLLIATDEDADEVLKQYEQQRGGKYNPGHTAIAAAIEYERSK